MRLCEQRRFRADPLHPFGAQVSIASSRASDVLLPNDVDPCSSPAEAGMLRSTSGLQLRTEHLVLSPTRLPRLATTQHRSLSSPFLSLQPSHPSSSFATCLSSASPPPRSPECPRPPPLSWPPVDTPTAPPTRPAPPPPPRAGSSANRYVSIPNPPVSVYMSRLTQNCCLC